MGTHKESTQPPAVREKRTRIFRHGRAPEAFARELKRQIKGRGESYELLIRKLPTVKGHTKNLLRQWAEGELLPRWPSSFRLLNRIEKLFDLPKNHFKVILFPRSATQRTLDLVQKNQYQYARRHIPEDFDSRSPAEQQRIVNWIKQNILSGGTDFGKFMKESTGNSFALRFPTFHDVPGQPRASRTSARSPSQLDAPNQLVDELRDLVAFKRGTIAPPGFRRFSGWAHVTASTQIRSVGRMFGALVAAPDSVVKGFGAPPGALTLAIFVFPAFWDWYLGWREQRRGFFTAHEISQLHGAVSLVRRYTGWIRQHPELATHLVPIPGLIAPKEVAAARKDWAATCDRAIEHFRDRIRELRRITRLSRDPFHPIMAVLKSESPLSEYKKIADEVLKQWPQSNRPLEVAEASRAYLALRFAMHLGLRQRNLRELLYCAKGGTLRSDADLEAIRRGELRWISRSGTWEVHVPALGFKNWDSTFFRHGPFNAVLPDFDNLYSHIDAYLRKHRAVLLANYDAPRTFFVRTLRSTSVSGECTGNSFLNLWQDTIKKYAIYNPYTGRGAIEGLLPHGPHSVRDVIATHLLKQTASYELAAFAIQDIPDAVKEHYSRFLPEEKSALAARFLNKVWA